ncbi:hypothetical protein G6F56_000837 [Rhizopus delemar]|uniref:FAR1 domain-containing protein n=1 Tax=Rhizopus stolonifer TaxID=4846 RepID=A0A367JMI6_RHIST|nr:hypothetical protein G6F56_000837 [Rhizopus delemar]RCH91079.1 hypothetical protein CU098_005669 [Rhizopus stolonifer]
MTKRATAKQTNEHNITQLQQGFTPEKQEEQSVYLEPFYERLIGITFPESTSAIEYCRELCAEFGFTVKQEASTHRNIYVYCSREGLPDSLRNPKTNPQRKRPSKRCDCRWRVVLFENEGLWEFRRSLNPEAGKHNHELMHPDEIERNWPKEVTDLIFELARLRMTTQDIRTRVQVQFPNVNWNERRFYNRLSEERQKIKQRDTADRTHDLCQLWSKICALTAGNDELSQFIKHELIALYQTLSDTTQVDVSTLPSPTLYSEDSSEIKEENGIVEDSLGFPDSRRLSKQSASSIPKGFMTVEIPKQTYYIKVHNQRLIQEAQLIRSQRRNRNLSDEAQMYMLQPPRKVSRKGKDRESSLLSTDERISQDNMFQLNHPPYPNSRTNSAPGTPTNGQASTPVLSTPPSIHMQRPQQPSSHQRQAQSIHTSPFVYTYDNNNMSLDSPLPGYIHSQFSNAYHMNTTPSPSSFHAADMQFQFDPSQPPMVRTGNEPNNAANSGSGSTMHSSLQPHNVTHKGTSLAQSMSMQHTNSQTYQHQAPQQSHQNSDIHSSANTNTNHQLYAISPSPILPNKPQIHRPSSQMRMYEQSPENMISNTRTLSPVEAQHQAATYQHNMYMRQAAVTVNHRHPNAVIPMYSQTSPSQDGSRMNIHQNHSQ